MLFHEPRDAARLLCLALIIAGIVGLKITQRPTAPDRPTAAPLTANASVTGDGGAGGS
jgi:hypothetical protein